MVRARGDCPGTSPGEWWQGWVSQHRGSRGSEWTRGRPGVRKHLLLAPGSGPGAPPAQASPGHRGQTRPQPPPTPCRHLPALPGLPRPRLGSLCPRSRARSTRAGPRGRAQPHGHGCSGCGAQQRVDGTPRAWEPASCFPTMGLGPQDVAGVDTWPCDLGCPVRPPHPPNTGRGAVCSEALGTGGTEQPESRSGGRGG